MFIYEFYLKYPHSWQTGYEVFGRFIKSSTDVYGLDARAGTRKYPIPNRSCSDLSKLPKKLRSFDVGLRGPRFFAVGFSFERFDFTELPARFLEVFDVSVMQFGDDRHYYSVARWIVEGIPESIRRNESWFRTWRAFSRNIGVGLIRDRMLDLAEEFFDIAQNLYIDYRREVHVIGFLDFLRPTLNAYITRLMDYAESVWKLIGEESNSARLKPLVYGSFAHLIEYMDRYIYHYGIRYGRSQELEGFFRFANSDMIRRVNIMEELSNTNPFEFL